ncbi:MAG: AI-2E family transporter [Firmicutes bacterium]|nr:AI-2E family transporter [Bacillota bacterium]
MNPLLSKIATITVLIGLLLLILWVNFKAFIILIPFMLAYALSKPLSRLTHRIAKIVPVPLGFVTLIVVFLFVSSFIFAVSYIIYRIAMALTGFTAHIDVVLINIQNVIDSLNTVTFNFPWLSKPVALNDLVLQSYELILKNLSAIVNSAVSSSLSALRTIPFVGLFFMFMFISLYFFIRDAKKVNQFFAFINARIKSPFIISLKSKTWSTFKNYIKAQLILVTITYIISFVALMILKVPFFPLIAFGIAFVDLIPMVGPAFVYVPWIIFSLLISEYSTVFGLLITYLATTLTRQTIEPKIVSEKIGTHPLITIISMYTCYRLFGVVGFIIGAVAVMFTLIAINVYKDLKQKHEHSTFF